MKLCETQELHAETLDYYFPTDFGTNVAGFSSQACIFRILQHFQPNVVILLYSPTIFPDVLIDFALPSDI